MGNKGYVTAILVGAGHRGNTYATYAKEEPTKFKIVAVADPKETARKRIKDEFDISKEFIFSDWKEVAAKEKFADCVILTTQDRMHKEPAIAFSNLGYHILLEKPMAVTADDCRDIAAAVKANGTIMMVCHVLKFMPKSNCIKKLIEDGTIGEIVNIQLLEPVGFWHFAHSYVRGNWHREEDSSCFLLAKCCHDIDLICYFMGKNRCTTVSSFGKLSHFTKEKKPSNAASRCLNCPADIEQSCPFSACKIYLERSKRGYRGWPLTAVVDNPDVENLTDALLHGPYGKCVYDSDNDVVSHQVVNMQFENGATASFTGVAFTERICVRQLKIFGTKGEIRCSFDDSVVHYDFNSNKTYEYEPQSDPTINPSLHGHGGADYYTIKSFVEAVQKNDPMKVLTGVEESLNSHLVVFAAEKARLENKVVTIHPDGTYT